MITTDKIPVSQIRVGMYVHKLDRPWTETPFQYQGFYLRTRHEIEEVQRFCKYVYIDCDKGTQPYKESEISKPSPLLAKERKNKSTLVNSKDLKTFNFNVGRYDKVSRPFKKEINNAKVLFADLAHSVEQVGFNIRVGKKPNISKTKSLAKSVVNSVIKNPNTMIWLSRLKDKGGYTYNHSLRSSILAIVFGRYLGLNEDDLIPLATGVLLADIGKTKISRKLLNKTGDITDSERATFRNHVELGVEMLATDKTVDHTTLVIVETHHERYDGSGYPYALVGKEIPFFGQIAGLVDVFDAVTNKKSYGKQLTSSQAMDWLYTLKGKDFSSELIESFIQAIGLYPAGTIVELTDDSVGLVVSHNPEKRLRPEVFMLRDTNQNKTKSKKTIDLSKRAFLSNIDRPMVRRAVLPEQLDFAANDLSTTLQDNKDIKKALLG